VDREKKEPRRLRRARKIRTKSVRQSSVHAVGDDETNLLLGRCSSPAEESSEATASPLLLSVLSLEDFERVGRGEGGVVEVVDELLYVLLLLGSDWFGRNGS
jgi:hypothetical protein